MIDIRQYELLQTATSVIEQGFVSCLQSVGKERVFDPFDRHWPVFEKSPEHTGNLLCIQPHVFRETYLLVMYESSPESSLIKLDLTICRPNPSAISIARCSFLGIYGYYSTGGLNMYCLPIVPTMVNRPLFLSLITSFTSESNNLGCTKCCIVVYRYTSHATLRMVS